MQEIIFRYDPRNPPAVSPPSTADDARRRLEEGNRAFARLLSSGDDATGSSVIELDPHQLGHDGEVPEQKPFAAVLACSDARVPTEMIFSRAPNDLFVARVAGNVLGDECLGSLEFAAEYLRSIRLFVVLGHSTCGAVTAAVDSYLDPNRYPLIAPTQSLRSVVGSLIVSVNGAARALDACWGKSVVERPRFRQALVETTVASHAALTAWTLERELRGTPAAESSRVVFGVYDIATRYVKLPLATGDPDTELCAPPLDSAGLEEHTRRIASGEHVRRILEG